MIGHSHLWEFCTVYRKTGQNANGQPTYGPAIPAACWITRKAKTLTHEDGTDIKSTAQVTLPQEIPISAQDKIMLPEGTVLKVQDVALVTGAYGVFSHSVAYL